LAGDNIGRAGIGDPIAALGDGRTRGDAIIGAARETGEDAVEIRAGIAHQLPFAAELLGDALHERDVETRRALFCHELERADLADAHAAEGEISPIVLIEARLYPDMLTFASDSAASDNTKNGVARIAGIDAPASLSELRERIQKTGTFLNAMTPKQLEGAEKRKVELRFRSLYDALDGRTYLLSVLVPNFFFHVATIHDLLRHNGVKIGKKEYLGDFPG
jgi:uncharacterized protein